MALDSNGFIRVPATVEFQAEFLPIITAISERLLSLLGKNLHSLYLYGSVAQGRALEGVSDLDVCIIVRQPVSESQGHQLADIAREIPTRYPAVSKVDFDIGELSDVLAVENRDSWGYWLKHHCRSIYGEDLTQRFPPFRPSRAIAIAVNGDFTTVLGKYIEQLTQLREGNDQQHIQRAVARKLIRSTNLLRSDADTDWPETLDEYAARLTARYPQKTDEMDYLLRESLAPADDIESFIRHVTAFMHWLETTRQIDSHQPE